VRLLFVSLDSATALVGSAVAVNVPFTQGTVYVTTALAPGANYVTGKLPKPETETWKLPDGARPSFLTVK